MSNSGNLENSNIAKILPRNVKGDYFAKRTEILKYARSSGISGIKRWKTWMTTAASKFEISLMKKCEFARVTHSDTMPLSALQSVRQKCSVTG